jgi:hypothetical protein
LRPHPLFKSIVALTCKAFHPRSSYKIKERKKIKKQKEERQTIQKTKKERQTTQKPKKEQTIQ